MSDIRWQTSFTQLGKALDRLDDILKAPLDEKDYVLDATIQRFEFCVELFWKALKHLLALEGVVTQLPKESLQRAFAAGWLEHEEIWLDMLQDRNITSHTYKHEKALEVYRAIQKYYPEMRKVYEHLKKKFIIREVP